MAELTRRRFITQSTVGAAAFVAAGTAAAVHVRGAGALPLPPRRPAQHCAGASSAPAHAGTARTSRRSTPRPSANSWRCATWPRIACRPRPSGEAKARRDVLRLPEAARQPRCQRRRHRHAQPVSPRDVARGIQAGKHVLCEKPAGVSLADATAMQRSGRRRQDRRHVRHAVPPQRPSGGRSASWSTPENRQAAVHRAELLARGDWNLGPNVWQYADPKLAGGKPRTGGSPTPPPAARSTSSPATTSTCCTGSPAAPPPPSRANGGIAVYKDGRDTWDHASVTLTYPGDVTAVHTLASSAAQPRRRHRHGRGRLDPGGRRHVPARLRPAAKGRGQCAPARARKTSSSTLPPAQDPRGRRAQRARRSTPTSCNA